MRGEGIARGWTAKAAHGVVCAAVRGSADAGTQQFENAHGRHPWARPSPQRMHRSTLTGCAWRAKRHTYYSLHRLRPATHPCRWVQAWKDATSTCATATTSTACASKATFEYDAAKLATFASAWPAFTSLGAGGNAPPGSSAPPPPSPGAALPARLPLLLLSALLALASLVVLAV